MLIYFLKTLGKNYTFGETVHVDLFLSGIFGCTVKMFVLYVLFFFQHSKAKSFISSY